MLASTSLCQSRAPSMALRLQPLALRKLSAALYPAVRAGQASACSKAQSVAMLHTSRHFMHKAEPPQRDLHAARCELARRESELARREEELAQRVRELALQEEDLRDRERLFLRAEPGDVVDSYLTCDHADIAWSLLRSEILGSNEAYPLESLWCTRGRLRCRLIVHSQGHFVKVSLSPAAITGLDLKAFELQCTLSVIGEEKHLIERLSMSVNEKDWHGNSLVMELGQCPEHTFIELQIHKFVGLLREGADHFANQDVPYSATDLVPSAAQRVASLGAQQSEEAAAEAPQEGSPSLLIAP